MSPSVEPFNEAKYKALMDGLECKELKLSMVNTDNEVFRFDAEYFNKNALSIIEKIKNIKHVLIEDSFDVSKLAGFEFTEYFTPTNMSAENSYIAVTSKNIQRNQLVLNDYITISKEIADKYLERSKLKKDDVVLSYTGEYRRALTLFVDDLQLGPNVCRLTPINSNINSKFLSVFLNSRIGQVILDKEKTLSAQPTVAMSRIRKIPVPVYVNLQKKIADMVVMSNDILIEAQQKYMLAQNLISDILDVDMHEKKAVAIKTYSSSFLSSGRLDAEYYQPKYDKFISVLNKFKLTNIPNEFDTFKNSGTDYSEESCDVGVVKTKQLTKDGIRLDNIESYFTKETCNKNKSTFIKNKDVIFASMGVGSLGRASIFTYEGEELFATDSTLKIYRSKEGSRILPEVLCVFLQSVIGKELIYRYVVGSTGIINIYDEDIAKIPIPILDTSIQEDIAEKVQESFRLRRKSKELLDIAIKAVEMAIETNEETALAWLGTQNV